MSETSNDITQPGLGAEALSPDDTRMAVPSRDDVTRGAAPAAWGPSTLAAQSELQPQPRDVEFGLVDTAKALGLPERTIDSTRAWLQGESTFTDDQLASFDAEHSASAEVELRALWNDKFIANFKTIDAYLDSLPGFAGDVFRNARDADGRALANNPAALQHVLGAAQLRGSTALAGSLGEQIAAIERTMREDRAAYNKDELLQARYRELLAMKERSK